MKTLGLSIAALLFAAAGCAATHAPANSTTPATANASSSFPERVSADGLSDALVDYDQLVSRRYDGSVNSRVRVCVKPSGQVSTASIIEPSGIPGFDRALAATVATWKYQDTTAANTETRCKNVRVIYQSEI
jgi:TonB family protein